MVWHQECWRRFLDGYEQETRGGDTPHGINITQVRSTAGYLNCSIFQCM
jgi:hypothetical protein